VQDIISSRLIRFTIVAVKLTIALRQKSPLRDIGVKKAAFFTRFIQGVTQKPMLTKLNYQNDTFSIRTTPKSPEGDFL
jgi:hypothetical protein